MYFPYFSVGTVFDDAATRARLEPSGISASPLRDYLERLLDFATRSRWGKRPIARVEALAMSLGSRRASARARLRWRLARSRGRPPRWGVGPAQRCRTVAWAC